MEKFGFELKNIKIGEKGKLVIIAGPCVIEEYQITFNIAQTLKNITDELGLPLIFKASYDKANRTSINSFRGPGIDKGLDILGAIKSELKIPVISDVHDVNEIKPASKVLDIIQIPAFLCRQTDLIAEAAKTGIPINIKKGQFLAPWDIVHAAQKAAFFGNSKITITERGSTYGYNNLVVDFRSLKIIKDAGWPVIFDATHSIQMPGGQGTCSGGKREFAPILAKAAAASGADGIFMEVHPNPDKALCDGPNSLYLDSVYKLLLKLKQIKAVSEIDD